MSTLNTLSPRNTVYDIHQDGTVRIHCEYCGVPFKVSDQEIVKTGVKGGYRREIKRTVAVGRWEKRTIPVQYFDKDGKPLRIVMEDRWMPRIWTVEGCPECKDKMEFLRASQTQVERDKGYQVFLPEDEAHVTRVKAGRVLVDTYLEAHKYDRILDDAKIPKPHTTFESLLGDHLVAAFDGLKAAPLERVYDAFKLAAHLGVRVLKAQGNWTPYHD